LTGVALFVVLPVPSWPSELSPQQYVILVVVIPQVRSPVTLTLSVAKLRPPPAVTGALPNP
jgi:hypothetical protein